MDTNKNKLKKNILSTQVDLSKFTLATEDEKRQQDVMSESTTFFKDGMRRLRKNPLAVVSICVLAFIILAIIIAPMIIPYSYEEIMKVDGQRDKSAKNVSPFKYSQLEEQYIIKEWALENGYDQNGVRKLNKKALKDFTEEELEKFFEEKDISKFDWVIEKHLTKPMLKEFLESPVKDSLTNENLSISFDKDDIEEIMSFLKKNGVDLSESKSLTEIFTDSGKNEKLKDFEQLLDELNKENKETKVSLSTELGDLSGDALNILVGKSVIKESKYRFPHIFGTDEQSRDYFIRVIYGTRVSLVVGAVASIIVLIIGMVYGSISGYFGGKVDLIMMRIVDIIYSLPDMLMVILLSVVLQQILNLNGTIFAELGTNMVALFIVFGLLYWVTMARLIRGQILSIKENDFVTAARSIGAKPGRIIKKHILPNCLSVIIISTALQIPSAIFTESYLSFVGLGVKAPMPSLGSLANYARDGIQSYPYKLLFPAIMICLIVLSLNLIGDGLRDAFDPKLKK